MLSYSEAKYSKIVRYDISVYKDIERVHVNLQME